MLLRYLAKQSAENYCSTLNIGSTNTTSHFISDLAAAAIASLWAEDSTAMIGDAGSSLASSLTDISNAMLTPLDNTVANLFGSGPLSAGLFADKKNNGFLG